MSEWKEENIERKLSQRDRGPIDKAPPAAKKKKAVGREWLVVYMGHWLEQFVKDWDELSSRNRKVWNVWDAYKSEEDARRFMHRHVWAEKFFVVEKDLFERVYKPQNKQAKEAAMSK